MAVLKSICEHRALRRNPKERRGYRWLSKVAIGALSAISITACATSAAPPDRNEPIDQLLTRAVSEKNLPGVIAIAATSDGIIYQGAAGLQDISTAAPMKTDAIMHMASMTKAITSVAVMQLVERGEISLDQPAGDILPFVAQAQVLEGFTEDGEQILRPATSAVTIRQLLTHTSGYSYEIWNPNIERLVSEGELPSHAASDARGFVYAPLIRDPGQAWEYSISTDILGLLIEEVSQQSLADYFQEHIFDPLKMSDSHFVSEVPAEKQDRRATAYFRDKSGQLIALPPISESGDQFYSGGAGVASTANDYTRFMRAILNDGALDGGRILKAETIELMAQNHVGDLEVAHNVQTAMPFASNDFDFFPGRDNGYGLGFLINEEPVPNGRAAGSLAWAGLFNGYYWIDPENDVCALLMTQLLPFYDADVIDLLNEFEIALYASME